MLSDKLYRFFRTIVEDKEKTRIQKETYPENLTEQLDIPYIEDSNPLHRLDVIRPENEEKLPLLIHIHGGGLVSGSKKGNRNYCTRLAKYGFLVMALDYSLSPEVRYPEHLIDIHQALLWIGDHANKYGWDGKNIFLNGDSAGGFLAIQETLVLGDKRVADLYHLLQPRFRLNATVLTSGMLDFNGFIPACMIPGIFGTWRKKKAPFFDKTELSQWVNRENTPPCLLITSDGDFLRSSTLRFHRLLNEKNIEHRLNDYKKTDKQKLSHVFAVLHPSTPAGEKCIDDTVIFLFENLK